MRENWPATTAAIGNANDTVWSVHVSPLDARAMKLVKVLASHSLANNYTRWTLYAYCNRGHQLADDAQSPFLFIELSHTSVFILLLAFTFRFLFSIFVFFVVNSFLIEFVWLVDLCIWIVRVVVVQCFSIYSVFAFSISIYLQIVIRCDCELVNKNQFLHKTAFESNLYVSVL